MKGPTHFQAQEKSTAMGPIHNELFPVLSWGLHVLVTVALPLTYSGLLLIISMKYPLCAS